MSDIDRLNIGEVLSSHLRFLAGTIELLPAFLNLPARNGEHPVQLESRLEELQANSSMLRRLGGVQEGFASELNRFADLCKEIQDTIVELYRARGDARRLRQLSEKIDLAYSSAIRSLQMLASRGITVAYLPRAQKQHDLLRSRLNGL